MMTGQVPALLLEKTEILEGIAGNDEEVGFGAFRYGPQLTDAVQDLRVDRGRRSEHLARRLDLGLQHEAS